MMAVIGFLAVLLVGICLTYAGVAGTFGMYAFTGKIIWLGLIVALIGLVCIYVACINCPFDISFAPRK